MVRQRQTGSIYIDLQLHSFIGKLVVFSSAKAHNLQTPSKDHWHGALQFRCVC